MADTLFEAEGEAPDHDVRVRISAGYGLDVQLKHRGTGRTVAHVSRGPSLAALRAGLAAKAIESPDVLKVVLELVDRGIAQVSAQGGQP